MPDLQALTTATVDLDPPLAVLDVQAFRANARDLVRRAGGKPIRVASKSVRCRWALSQALATPGFAGVMAYSVREAIWLARAGVTDVLLGYPSADRGALAELGADESLHSTITLMVDDVAQLELTRSVTAAPLQACLDVDASLRLGRVHLGVRRSPLRTAEDATRLAGEVTARGFALTGVMFYEALIAGMADSSPAIRALKRRTGDDVAGRRAAVVAALPPLRFVNSGGTGSLEVSSSDPAVTEVTAGSGLYCPTLFDGYRAFEANPALFFALPVVRKPARGIATLFGGGYVASGPAGASRLPSPVQRGLKLIGTEGAGEVQTPVSGRAARKLAVGDRVWFRPAKAGEQLERFGAVHLVDGPDLVDSVPTYRGEGRSFG